MDSGATWDPEYWVISSDGMKLELGPFLGEGRENGWFQRGRGDVTSQLLIQWPRD